MRFESFWHRIEGAILTWRDAKLFFDRSLTVSTEFIHAVVGILILLLAAALLRKPVSSWSPWLVVLAFAVVNELLDLSIDRWPQQAMQLGESVNDLWVTLLLPSVLLFTARKMPWLYRAAPEPPSHSSGTDPSL